MEAARKNGVGQKAKKKRAVTTMRCDGRETVVWAGAQGLASGRRRGCAPWASAGSGLVVLGDHRDSPDRGSAGHLDGRGGNHAVTASSYYCPSPSRRAVLKRR